MMIAILIGVFSFIVGMQTGLMWAGFVWLRTLKDNGLTLDATTRVIYKSKE